MKLTVTRCGDSYAGISMEAESCAEKCQIQDIASQLEKADTDWAEWGDMEGHSGICIKAKLRDKQ